MVALVTVKDCLGLPLVPRAYNSPGLKLRELPPKAAKVHGLVDFAAGGMGTD